MDFADGLSSEWLSILFALWLKSIIILTAVALLIHKLRAASAKLRHILLCAALSSLLALPLFSVVLQPFRLPILPAGLFQNELATQQPSRESAFGSPEQSPEIFPADSDSQARSALSLVDEELPVSSFSWGSIILLV